MKVVEIDPRALPEVCRRLRTKSTFGAVIGGELVPWEAGENAAASYWCLATSGPAGPDEAPVHPRSCLPGRECWRQKE
ncbi:MAG TPA: hypothetical protein VMS56_06605 [Thermoanaerobaculia bacterium]|nr:hypothetical protein [Thermoanaerobaculia bacterium]